MPPVTLRGEDLESLFCRYQSEFDIAFVFEELVLGIYGAVMQSGGTLGFNHCPFRWTVNLSADFKREIKREIIASLWRGEMV